MAIELQSDYYLDNFTTLLDFVDDLYADILEQPERRFSSAFRACSRDGRRLYVRLISRKGPHFRADKLHYGEISALPAAARELAEAGLLAIDSGPCSDWLPLLARAEILDLMAGHGDLFADVSGLGGSRKEALLQLAADRLDEDQLRTAIKARFSVYTPLQTDVLLTYRLLFFGNLHQDLTEFVLQDLGLLRYEDYPIAPEDRLFCSRRLVLHTITYAQLAEVAHAAVAAGDSGLFDEIFAALPDTLEERALRSRRDKIVNLMARQLEREGAADRALALYEASHRPPARERRARLLERAGRYEDALELARAMADDARDLSESEFAPRFIPKIEKKLGLPALVPKRSLHPQTDLVLARDDGQRIEALVLAHYRARGQDGFYAENRFWQSLFGLAFWDIIFAPVRGAFFNRFQRGPADLFSARFAEDRRTAIADRLAELVADPAWAERVLATYDRKQGLANHLVHWRFCPREQIELALARVARPQLAAIFDRFAGNPGTWRNGFPDLFLAAGTDSYELVEVKGPGDQLQDNQRRWLAWLNSPARSEWPEWVTTSKVKVVPFYDRTGLIYATLGTLETALVEEILITIIVVLVMVRHLLQEGGALVNMDNLSEYGEHEAREAYTRVARQHGWKP